VIPYELAKELKEAGLPQNIYFGSDFYDTTQKGKLDVLRWGYMTIDDDPSHIKVPALRAHRSM
jgi:hypothetical protein